MNFVNIDLAIFLLILAVAGVASWYGYRQVKSEAVYLFAGRKTGFFALTSTLVMTEFNTATLIAFSSLGYYAGIRALLLPLIFLIAISFYAVAVAKKWKEFDGSSVAEFFSKKYDKRIGKAVSAILLIAMSCFTASYIKSLAMIFSPLFPMVSMWLLSAILVAIILVVTLRGGLVAIIQVDLVSFVLVCIFFPALLYFAAGKIDGDISTALSSVAGAKIALPSRFVISLICISMFTYILAPWYGQKIFAAKTKKIAFTSTITASVFVFLLYSCAVLAVALFRTTGATLSNIEQGFPEAIHFFLPAGWRGFGYSILFIAATTTLAGVWSAMSTMVIVDFLPSRNQSKFSRGLIITLLIAVFTYILSNTFIDQVF